MPSLPHNSLGAKTHPAHPVTADEFSPDERAFLLKLAHDAIESVTENRTPRGETPSAHLAQRRGVFTTIYLHGELRGCVGYVFAVMPLYQAVQETARAAASQDTRFDPVSREEALQLRISLSILSALAPIDPEEIELGRHGLVVTMAGNRELQTCRKAGLPIDAWKAGAALEAFTAEVFGDPDSPV